MAEITKEVKDILNGLTGVHIDDNTTVNEVIKIIASKWNPLSEDDRDKLTKVIVGVRQKNVFSKLLEMSDKELRERQEIDKAIEELRQATNDKKNIETLVSVTKDMLKQKAVDLIDNKPEPKITISAKVDTVDLHCKKCGAHLINLIPKQYSPYRNDGKNNDKDMPVIKYDIVSENSVCDQCGCNLFNADIKIAIEPIKSNTIKIDAPMIVAGK